MRDLETIRAKAEADTAHGERDARLASFYQRAAFRPWQQLPPLRELTRTDLAPGHLAVSGGGQVLDETHAPTMDGNA